MLALCTRECKTGGTGPLCGVSAPGNGPRMTFTDQLDRETARNAVGAVSMGLGVLGVLAPRTTARAFGVRGAGALPLLVRMVGVRNAALGLRTLQATGAEERRSVQTGLALGVVDGVAVLTAVRNGVLSKKAAAGVLVVLAALAALGLVAAQED